MEILRAKRDLMVVMVVIRAPKLIVSLSLLSKFLTKIIGVKKIRYRTLLYTLQRTSITFKTRKTSEKSLKIFIILTLTLSLLLKT